MRLVVQTAPARRPNVPGYLVGGKTGTADKQKGRGYATNARLASFVGAFPMNDPRFAILVMVDEPKPNATSHGYATAGWVTAPVIGAVVAAHRAALRPEADARRCAGSAESAGRHGRRLRFANRKKGAIRDQTSECAGPDAVRRRCRADAVERVGAAVIHSGGAA